MAEQEQAVERALSNLAGVWRDLAQSTARTLGMKASDAVVGKAGVDKAGLRRMMARCLDGKGGEVSARLRTAELGRTYLELDQAGRETFLSLLAEDYAVKDEVIQQAIAEYQDCAKPADRVIAAYHLRMAATPPRLKLLTQFNALPEGVKFLVDLRADLLKCKKDDPYLGALDRDLQQLLTSWFDTGFLDLVEITWKTSAALLEKLIAYEAVHQITSWDDLRNRLDSDRRCYALFHPRMPEEPLAFVEVALVKGLADNVQALLDVSAPRGNPREADTAIFYSITNTQTGLRGISFGEHLIKQVVHCLSHEMPWIKTYATLSPVPGFRAWLGEQEHDLFDAVVSEEERQQFKSKTGADDPKTGIFVAFQDSLWHEDVELAELLKGPLLRLAAAYYLDKDKKGRPVDPVARFHLKNGAHLDQINWLGDTSGKGINQSAGIMVNYRYDLDDIEKNHERFMKDGTVVMSSKVRALTKQIANGKGEEGPFRRLRRSLTGQGKSPEAEKGTENS